MNLDINRAMKWYFSQTLAVKYDIYIMDSVSTMLDNMVEWWKIKNLLQHINEHVLKIFRAPHIICGISVSISVFTLILAVLKQEAKQVPVPEMNQQMKKSLGRKKNLEINYLFIHSSSGTTSSWSGLQWSRAYARNTGYDTGIHLGWDASPITGHNTHTFFHLA